MKVHVSITASVQAYSTKCIETDRTYAILTTNSVVDKFTHWPGAPTPNDGADIEMISDIRFVNDTMGPRFVYNGIPFMFPEVPSLLKILSGATAAADILPSGAFISNPRNKIVQISFTVDADPNGANLAGPHPMQLHGHTFDVIRSADSATYNFVNPPRRDVVSMGGPGSNVTIRFKTDNPGPWLLHCQIELHLAFGLGAYFVEDAPTNKDITDPPKEWAELCDIYNSLPAEDQ